MWTWEKGDSKEKKTYPQTWALMITGKSNTTKNWSIYLQKEKRWVQNYKDVMELWDCDRLNSIIVKKTKNYSCIAVVNINCVSWLKCMTVDLLVLKSSLIEVALLTSTIASKIWRKLKKIVFVFSIFELFVTWLAFFDKCER